MVILVWEGDRIEGRYGVGFVSDLKSKCQVVSMWWLVAIIARPMILCATGIKKVL